MLYRSTATLKNHSKSTSSIPQLGTSLLLSRVLRSKSMTSADSQAHNWDSSGNTARMEAVDHQDVSRRHVCSFCGRGFRKPEHVRRHTRIHTLEKPYPCPCGTSFSRRDLLRRHERLAHNGNQLEPGSSITTTDSISFADNITATRPRKDRTGQLEQTKEPQSVSLRANSATRTANDSIRSLPALSSNDDQSPLNDFQNFLANSTLWTLVDDQDITGSRPPLAAGLLERGTNVLDPDFEIRVIEQSNRNTIMSDSAVQEYMTRCPTFIVPSFRTIGRYLRSFYRNFSVPVMHEHYERTGRVIAALRLAILALGARFLLELRSSVALFNASRDIVLNHWTWSTQNASLEDDNSAHQLAATFMLLLECIKMEQSETLVYQMGILQSGLVHYVALSHNSAPDSADLEGQFASWVRSETSRRIEVFGVCAAASHAFLFDDLCAQVKTNSSLRLPCSSRVWATATAREFEQRLESQEHRGPFAVEWFQNVSDQADVISDPEVEEDISVPRHCYIAAAFLGHRVAFLSNGHFAGSATRMQRMEFERIGKTAIRFLVALEAERPSPDALTPLESKAKAIMQLILVRLALSLPAKIRMIPSSYAHRPLQLATAYYEWSWETPTSPDILLYAIRHSIDLLKYPASTGVVFFVRSGMSSWSVELLVLVFESALLLSRWVQKSDDLRTSHQGTSSNEDAFRGEMGLISGLEEIRLLRRLLTLLQSAWSSFTDTDEISDDISASQLSLFVLRFWANVLETPENTEFARLLGRTLAEYAKLLESTPQ
ncbi:hypothetical protein PDE_06847 [Penicillium oxalicum 114-2]|uniref:C2H2-type domain-containing protein n=1 Tax=Penicillium oxalicum (strain 114-2 / CGMCC 5302) TaxID=933388 RepID=S7ZNH8_PENO1|nr:hypothetical protein PDE_06847 [Penicillium oxalicum 114-2]